MTLGYTEPLLILAFDHRGSFQTKLLGIPGTPTPTEVERIETAKRLIYRGFEAAVAEAHPAGAGILVDEQFGAGIARSAHEQGTPFAMPVEQTGKDEFDFEYGREFGEHIDAFDPTFAKVLVRYNPAGTAELNARQAKRLARLSTWLHEHDRKYLFELLVPAEAHQLADMGGDPDRYDRELRPSLMIEAIGELREAGVEPDVWKIEGLDRRQDCERVAAATREGGRDEVACVVLGRGGDEAKVVHWLQTGAGVPGYVGFAVGRTIWWDALTGWLQGDPEEEAVAQIAATYGRLVEAYASAS